jgi:hypothetical protein
MPVVKAASTSAGRCDASRIDANVTRRCACNHLGPNHWLKIFLAAGGLSVSLADLG